MLNRIKNIFTKEELKSTLMNSSTRTITLAIISLLIPVTLTFIEWENAKADILNHAERNFKFKIDEASNKILKRMHTYEQVISTHSLKCRWNFRYRIFIHFSH